MVTTSIITFVALGVMEMKWSLLELQKYRNEPLIFSEEIDLKESIMVRESEILDISPVTVKGTLIVQDEIIARLEISLVITLPSSRSLKPVSVPMLIEANELYVPKDVTDFAEDEKNETVIYLDKDQIDLTETVEDSILLNLPMQVFTPEEEESDELPSGNDWEVISQEMYEVRIEEQKTRNVDPRLAGLADLFPDESRDNQE